MGSIPTVSNLYSQKTLSSSDFFFSGVSHSGQLQGTVNPSSSEYVGSNPTTPILHPQLDLARSIRLINYHRLRKIYALDCSKPQQFSFYFSLCFCRLSLFVVKQVRQVKRRDKNLSHPKNPQVKQVKQKRSISANILLEVRKNCVIGKHYVLKTYV